MEVIPPSWKIGETGIIMYDPKDPSKAKLFSYFRLFAWPLVLVSLAIPLILMGGGYLIANLL
ncbi:hypothetical protein DRW42_00130 [Pedobacter miscanthi]|uniref:Uncharacterized protein n=1 Tax=Pedobacter miscanthi TaxID=2259170 RepID=A0A366LEM2_9SPHI|nr:hypothetical protein DRW42_00130 [Pedobacter miscanthi]